MLHLNAPFSSKAELKQNDRLRLLLVEDSALDGELILREFRRAGFDVEHQRVQTEPELREALRNFTPDLILSDFSMPRFSGAEALSLSAALAPETPFVFVSGTIGEERAVDALKLGATDYVLKDRLRRLVPAVKRALQDVEVRAEHRRVQVALKESEERFRSFMQHLPGPASITDAQGRYACVNDAALLAFGRKADDVLGRDHDAVWPAPYAASLKELHEKVMRTGEATQHVFRTRSQGIEQWWLSHHFPIPNARGATAMVGTIALNITEQKRQEEKIARLSRIHAVLSGINSTIVRVTDRNQLFREACRIAVEDGQFKMAWIGLVVPGASKVNPVAWTGSDEGYLEEVGASIKNVSVDKGLAGQALRDKSAVVANDLEADPRVLYKKEALAHGFHSLAVLPLVVADAVVGVFVLYAAEKNFFDHEERRLLNEIAGDVSFALDHIAKAESLDYLAYYDSVTGIPNRKLFGEQVNQLIPSAAREDHGMAVVMLDHERFRHINETLGMAAGDSILKQLAQRLTASVGEPGTVARITADRFAIALLPVRSETEIAHVLQERVLDALSEPLSVAGQTLRVPAKAGVAVYPNDGKDAATLLLNAEAALLRAKQCGERFLFYAPQMNAKVAAQLKLENDLREAVLEERFVLHYQPRIDLQSGAVCGLEALIRWEHPLLGLVSPGEFIPLLEQTGLILDVGRWALRQAGLDYAEWAAQGLSPPRVAVNVSQVQLRRKDFVSDVKAALAAAGGHGDRIDIEITESMLMEDIEGSIAKLGELRATGLGVSLDDFGTGHSSLSWLARLPVDSLKIDRSFIVNMAKGPEHMAIVSTVITLAEALNLNVVAEGVETKEQADLLRLLRCNEAQGYLISRPLPADQLVDFLRSAPGIP